MRFSVLGSLPIPTHFHISNSSRLCVSSTGHYAQIIVLDWRLNEVIGRFMIEEPLTRSLGSRGYIYIYIFMYIYLNLELCRRQRECLEERTLNPILEPDAVIQKGHQMTLMNVCLTFKDRFQYSGLRYYFRHWAKHLRALAVEVFISVFPEQNLEDAVCLSGTSPPLRRSQRSWNPRQTANTSNTYAVNDHI